MTYEAWQEVISEIPTLWGRMAYLGSLRDENSGIYRYFALEKSFSVEECNRVLQQSHRAVFYDWLGLSLEEQKNDLLETWRDLPSDLPSVLATWDKLEPYRLYLPADASRGDRQLFLTDLRIILDLLIADQAAPLTSVT